MLTIGLSIKKLREIRGYSQDFMALKLKISQEQYSYLENKQKNIPEDYIKIIAALLEISVDGLKSFDPLKVVNDEVGASVNNQKNINLILLNSHKSEIEAYKELINVLKEEVSELRKRLK